MLFGQQFQQAQRFALLDRREAGLALLILFRRLVIPAFFVDGPESFELLDRAGGA